MNHVRPTVRRRLVAGLLPILLSAGALPLLAPTCGGGAEGVKTFARNSLIIPMDVCYQYQTDGSASSYTPFACPQATDPGDVIKAYGLVYQLIRNGVAVYWVIDQSKDSLTKTDLTVQYDGGFPVFSYDWTTGLAGTPPTQGHAIDYRGGPFVVDGSDFDKASAILQKYKGTFGTGTNAVNVHVANVAFRGYVKKTMAGGWNAGATVPPKIALLDIGSGELTPRTTQTLCTSAADTTNGCDANYCIGTTKNSQQVIEGYLIKAGIGGTTCADPNDCPGGVAAGPHGQIYDKLTMDDFQPTTPGDWTTTNLYKNGYDILWVPHWTAPGSCSAAPYDTAGDIRKCACLATRYPDAKIAAALQTIGTFVTTGHDLFGECSGLGSFEGVTNTSGAFVLPYNGGAANTHFQASATQPGFRINQKAPGAPKFWGSYTSPLLQLGDYPFKPVDGAIKIYRPYAPDPGYVRDTSGTQLVSRLVSDATDTTLDYFTLLPNVLDANGVATRGSVVYLAGHSYTDRQGTFQVAGTRLVLNTLFNLGAGCTVSGVSCDTGKLGVCAKGTLTCTNGQPVCAQTTFPSPETCNGLDDDCDGLVDEGLETACYDGPAGTKDQGVCRAGVRSCEQKADGSFGMGACVGEVLPGTEVCNGLDDDCDGQIDENIAQACYFGPSTSLDPATGQPRGVCKAGTQTCTSGTFGTCVGQVLPSPEICQEGAGTTALDEDCDGVADNGCGCTDGTSRPCYTGPGGTAGVGLCHLGTQTCASGGWGECGGEVTPQAEVCTPTGQTPADENCNGQVDEGCGCAAGSTEQCYAGPASTAGVGTCVAGTRACVSGEFSGTCTGQILPGLELCDGQDNDCNGLVDDGASCGSGFACVSGQCVPSSCGVERPCPEGFSCTDAGQCAAGPCGAGAPCVAGLTCEYGACVDRCPTDPADPRYVNCGAGSTCSRGTGTCVGGSCYLAGCPSGQLCLGGACVADPCDGVSCPGGTFCRQGFCVQSCAFVTCPSGQKCSEDGFCVSDPCSSKTCSAGQRCQGGVCVTDPCAGVGCGSGQVCDAGACVDDPCTGVTCSAGRCAAGQCYPIGGSGAATVTGRSGESASCGCGSGASSPFSLLLLVLAIPLARRRRTAPVAVPARRSGAPRAGGLLIAIAALGLLGSACQKSKETFDPSKCVASANVVACDGESRCVDLSTDPAHCGSCSTVCAAGETCAATSSGGGICGPSSSVAPYLRSADPGFGAKGSTAPIQVTLTGDRIQAPATVRVTSTAGTRTYDTVAVDATHVQFALDVSDLPATTLYVRLVNPNRVISNGLAFDVRTPAPLITAVAPSTIDAGKTTDVLLTGTGFIPATRCMIRVQGLELGVASVLGDTGLTCTIEAGSYAPGTNNAIWAVNDDVPSSLPSNELPFTIRSQTPVLNEVSPSSAAADAIASITLTGTGFDVSSQVLVNGVATTAQTIFVDSTRLVVPQLQLALYDCSAGCAISVRNGSGTPSNAKSFFEGTAPPQISGQPQPTTAYQGDTVTVTFDAVASFPKDTVIQVEEPGGSTFTAISPPLAAAAATISGTLSLVGKPSGDWLMRLLYPGVAGTSGAYPLRVLSNQAILQDSTVRGGLQGKSIPLVLSATNLRPLAAPDTGIRVRFAGAAADLVPTAVTITLPVPGTGTVGATLSTVGLDTGTYALQVVNPNGATPSNAISFSVTPGLPTLSGVSPATAARSDTPVLIVLTGTNFAKPDALGNGGSSVHIRDTSLGIADYALPAASVVVKSATRIEVTFDTRTGVPGTYDVEVWNPADPSIPPDQYGNVSPQVSGWRTGAFQILP